ncbi:polysaccharide deacetylase family protein [Caldifermentibacillus hisashii]|uniref:polysaccharide deacetylase family protein n=1 Tax=Caldifermentibacillus hisashii TaxID=996558 RepID=UPI0034467B6F
MAIINEVKTNKKALAITFDDGPNPIYTLQVLEVLASVKAKATFFMIGEQIVKNLEIVKLVVAQGHEIGNHTFTHARLSDLSEEECIKEIQLNGRLIERLVGRKPTTLRPPYFAFNEQVELLLSRMGYTAMGALNMDAIDWERPGTDFILEKSRNHVKNGSILIFHDGYGDRSQTIEAVRQLVPELVFQGYKLVTVSELLKIGQE